MTGCYYHAKEGASSGGEGEDGLLKISAMTTASSIGYQLAYRHGQYGNLDDSSTMIKSHRSKEHELMIQVAYSFETLVETLDLASFDEIQDQTSHATALDNADKFHPSHLAYLNHSLASFGITKHVLDKDSLSDILSDPPGGSFTQRSTRKKTQSYHSQGRLPYAHNRPLQVVKILRIITVSIPSTGKINVFLQGQDGIMTSGMMIRQVFQHALRPSTSSNKGDEERVISASSTSPASAAVVKVLNRCSHRCGVWEVINIMGRIILATYQTSKHHHQSQHQQRRLGSSAAHADSNDDLVTKMAMLRTSLIASSSVNELVFILANYVCKLIALNTSLDSDGSCTGITDKAAVFMLNALTHAPGVMGRTVYPLFQGVNEDRNHTLIPGEMSLARDAMITSGAHTFLLDAGEELILYKNITSRYPPPATPAAATTTTTTTTLAAVRDSQIRDAATGWNAVPSAPSSQGGMDDQAPPPVLTYTQLAEQRQDMKNGLIGHLIRRLSHYSLLTTALKAEAGMATAAYLTPHLLLDGSAADVSYSALLEFVLEVTALTI
jgi:hypothetical protein